MPVSPDKHSELPADTLDIPEILEPDNPLWRFALTFWALPGVQDSCLALQQQGWNVTRILCAGWLALNGRSYTGIEDATLTEWRHRVTGVLRALRKSLPKRHSNGLSLRNTIASAELEAEQIELALAWHTLKHGHPEKTMQGSNRLVRQNLKSAAPATGLTTDAQLSLNTLASVLDDLAGGDLLP